MKTFLLILIFGSFFLLSSHSEIQPDTLSVISREEALNRILGGEKQAFVFAAYRNANGNKMSSEEKVLLNEGKMTRRYYQDRLGKLIQVRCFPIITDEDLFYEIRLTEFLTANPLDKVQQIDIDCDPQNLERLFAEVANKDQSFRTGSADIPTGNPDAENRIVIVSIIEQCGFPTTKKGVKSAWFVMQHSGHTGLMEYYHPKFKAATRAGLLSKKLMAMMDDRLLMHHGFPQIYGTQLSGGFRSSDGSENTLGQTFGLHEVRDWSTINERRADAGLESIEEFAKRKGIELFSKENSP